MTLSTACDLCHRAFDLDAQALKAGYATWRRCPECREAKADENRRKIEQAKANTVMRNKLTKNEVAS